MVRLLKVRSPERLGSPRPSPWPRGATIIVFLLGACRDTLGPGDIEPDLSAPVQSSALYYLVEKDELGWNGLVPVSYVNRSGQPVFLDLCETWLEWLPNRTWVKAHQGVCPGGPGFLPPTRIDPGQAFQLDYRFSHWFDPNVLPRFPTDPPTSGVYRVVMQFYARTEVVDGVEEPRDPLPLDSGRSNAFWLEFPP